MDNFTLAFFSMFFITIYLVIGKIQNKKTLHYRRINGKFNYLEFISNLFTSILIGISLSFLILYFFELYKITLDNDSTLFIVGISLLFRETLPIIYDKIRIVLKKLVN